MASDGGERVAVQVGAPLPARRVRMTGSDIFGLESFELLLGTELVSLFWPLANVTKSSPVVRAGVP